MAVARVAEAPVDPMFLDRWSPRAFADKPVSTSLLRSLFEAARWAPSSSNEQPWLYVFASTAADRDKFVEALVESNRRWARSAPVLIFLFARRNGKSGKPNKWAGFDAGASWMSLAFEARKLGLYTHAMAGFEEKLAYERAAISAEDYEAMAAIAVGYAGDAETLPPDLKARESPSNRKPLAEVARNVAESSATK